MPTLRMTTLICGIATALGGLPPVRGEATTPQSDDEIVARWTFDSPADADAWTAPSQCEKLGVHDGALRLKLTGPDAFVSAPAVKARMDGCAIRVRMRCDRRGVSEIFYVTDKDPEYSPRQRVFLETPASRDFQVYDFVLGTPRDTDRQLIGFRIDPHNDNTSGLVEIDSIEVVRLAPVFDVCFAPADARVPGDTVLLRLSVRQTAGRAVTCDLTAAIGDAPAVPLRPADGGRERVAESRVGVAGPGYHRFTARLSLGGISYELETGASSLAAEQPERKAFLQGDRLRMELIPDAGADRRFYAGRLWARDGKGEWVDAGLVQPLMTLVTQDGTSVRSRAVSFREEDCTSTAVRDLSGGEPDAPASIRLRLGQNQGREFIEMHSCLRAGHRLEVLQLAAPTLLAGRPGMDAADRYGLFGGIEFLEPGWESSSARAVGEKFAERWKPHAHKITIPLMAIEQKGLTTALLWQPLDQWNGDRDRPAATFASPNFIDRQPNHLMRLSVPGVCERNEENRLYPGTPVAIGPEAGIRLRCVIVAEPDTPVASLARRWYEIFGAPDPPPAPHDAARMHEICMQNYGQTLYWPEDKGWRHHMYLEQASAFAPDVAAALLSHAARSGNDRWVKATGIAGRSIIDTLGPLASRVARPPNVQGALSSQRPDGTWAFKNTPQMIEQTRKLTDGKYADLGEDGSTSLGTTVMPALPVLRHALLTGDPECVAAGLKALDAMKQFRVPRGAQVWEVHQLVPDIRAAALAVEAYRLGYQITHDAQHLDQAQYWAWAGVPFLYSWRVPVDRKPAQIQVTRNKTDWRDRAMRPAAEGFENPRREIMPYATIPVLGTTFYVISWFGSVVQWCGLEWAYQVLDLAEFRADPLLRQIAVGVIRSGQQQMLDREPWVGLYPDVWDLTTNSAVGAYIGAKLPLECLRAMGDAPADGETWSRVVAGPAGKLHVSGWGRLRRLTVEGSTLAAEVDFAPGQASELLLVNADKPVEIRAGAAALEAGIGNNRWHYSADRRVVAARFTGPTAVTQILVRW